MTAKQHPEVTEPLEGESEADACEQETPFAAGESSEPSRPSRREGAAVGVLLSDVPMRSVEWIWPGHIALGKMTVIDGNPGTGKSTVSLDITARVTVGGRMPDGSVSCLSGPRGVVLLSAEDGAGDTIRPRLEAAGGDPHRVRLLQGVVMEEGERMPTIGDLGAIEETVRSVEAAHRDRPALRLHRQE